MKKSRLDNPKIKEAVIKELAVGTPQTVIARQLGLNQSSISRFANKEEVSDLIEQEQYNLVEVVPDAVENVKSLVKEMKHIPKKEIKRRELSYKASKDVLESVGLLPSRSTSYSYQQIINAETNIYQDPLIKGLIEEHVARLTGKTVEGQIKQENEEEQENE